MTQATRNRRKAEEEKTMTISVECEQYMGKALKQLATGDVDGLDLDNQEVELLDAASIRMAQVIA